MLDPILGISFTAARGQSHSVRLLRMNFGAVPGKKPIRLSHIKEGLQLCLRACGYHTQASGSAPQHLHLKDSEGQIKRYGEDLHFPTFSLVSPSKVGFGFLSHETL